MQSAVAALLKCACNTHPFPLFWAYQPYWWHNRIKSYVSRRAAHVGKIPEA